MVIIWDKRVKKNPWAIDQICVLFCMQNYLRKKGEWGGENSECTKIFSLSQCNVKGDS